MRRFADRVKETSTTTGTGPYNLAGAATGFRTFVSGVGSGFRCYYCAENGSDWEVGVGTVTSGSPDTLARTEVLKSSNGDAAVNWGAGTKNLFLTIPAKRVGLQTNFVDGLGLLWVSSTQVKVKAGTCRDGGDLEELTLASDTTLSIATLGAINGTDEFTSARTATTDGTTTVVASGSVTSELLPKTHASITFSTSTTTLTASADVRGYLMVGDLVGNTTTYGYSRVTAINNTGLTVTLAAALPGGDAGAGTALTKLENPTMKVGALAAVGITTINAAGTSIVVTATQATGGPGTAIKFGVERESTWYAVWVTNESGTIGTRLSTQRTTPYSTAAAKRRVGWVRNDVSGNVMEFSFLGIGLSRRMHFEVEAGRAALRVVSNGTGATDTWVKYSFADAVPPTSSIVWAFVGRSGGVNMSLYTRPAGFGLSTVSRNTLMQLQVDNHGFPVGLFCDLAQQIEFTQTGGTTGVYVDVAGYEDDLTR